jgi:hypothetical protein
MPTELTNVIDHFLCRICKLVVFQPKECPKCTSVYCFECNSNFISNKGKWQCIECNSYEPLVEMHRVVKEILEKLVFQCPLCSEVKRTYNEINKHTASCDGGINRDEATLESIKKIEQSSSLVIQQNI